MSVFKWGFAVCEALFVCFRRKGKRSRHQKSFFAAMRVAAGVMNPFFAAMEAAAGVLNPLFAAMRSVADILKTIFARKADFYELFDIKSARDSSDCGITIIKSRLNT